MDELKALLGEILPQVDFDAREKLVSGGVLDSISYMIMISGISERFGIDIPVEELTVENFDSLDSIFALVNRLGGAGA